MGDYTYRLTLTIEHPDADLSEFARHLGLLPKRVGRKGDPRLAPDGRMTGRVYRHSSCTFQFGADFEHDLPKGVRSALAALLPYKSYLDEWSAKGAKLRFFVGWFSDFNSRDVLDWEILRDLAELRISLDLDFYGSDDRQNEETDQFET
jgi:hypothetical protein